MESHMKKNRVSGTPYFPYDIQIRRRMWERLDLESFTDRFPSRAKVPRTLLYREMTERLNLLPGRKLGPVKASNLLLYALLNKVSRFLLDEYLDDRFPTLEEQILCSLKLNYEAEPLADVLHLFVEIFPGARLLERRAESASAFLAGDDPRGSRKRRITRELLLLMISGENPALEEFRELFDDELLGTSTPYREVTTALDTSLKQAPPYHPFDLPILELLRAPFRACPSSLEDQLEFIRTYWISVLPPEMLEEILSTFDIVREEDRVRGDGPGPPRVLEFGRKGEEIYPAGDYPEPERFSPDRDWMPNVVLIAKMVYVWLDQLSRKYGRTLTRLDEIPDEELDSLAAWGFTGLWLIGVWERSPASRMIKRYCGNPDAISSAYSLYDYVIAADLGGAEALENLRSRALHRGIRLASDMVPNHTGIDSRWTREHPDWFVQLDYPPYPCYRFEGPDLSSSSDISLQIEEGYWSKSDAAVVFRHRDNRTGRVRYIYHGNDGTSTPWNDTAQLNYLIPEVRETVIRTILHVARSFPIIRFDAAMTLAKKHYQRLWFPQPGLGGGIPSRAEHALSRMRFDELFPVEFWREVVDRVAAEAPDTLLLAEAFWLMEGYFVRTLGMHRVYNSAFMNMLKMEENAKYRQTIKNVLEFNPEILQRFVNFMNNPDERTAVEQFGREGKYFGAAVLLATMPGLPMFGHGQIEGFTEKYGMEYRRAYWTEEIDRHMVAMHEAKVFPLMKKRRLFSGAENFVLYDFVIGDRVDENVFAYSNRCGDERALIVYHNRFATTAGWIRTSCIRALKDGSGGMRNVRTSLGEFLGAASDGRFYYRFRDYATGLEYLRHGRDLVENGLYVELEAYEYHAFLDFREIRDDDYGSWGKLCGILQGRPVTSLDEEIKQVRYARVFASLGALTDALPGILSGIFDAGVPEVSHAESLAVLGEKLPAFFSALGEEAGIPGDVQRRVDRVLADIANAKGLAELKSRRRGVREIVEAFSPVRRERGAFTRLLLALYLVLRRTATAEGATEPVLTPVQIAVQVGLFNALKEFFAKIAVSSPNYRSPWEDGAEVALLQALLSHDSFLADQMQTPEEEHLAALWRDVSVAQFIRLHTSGGIDWFNRERFEDLIGWLFLTAAATREGAGKGGRTAIEGLLLLHGAAQSLTADAEKAGYRPDMLLAIRKVKPSSGKKL